MQPRDTNAIADREAASGFTDLLNNADDLVAGNDRLLLAGLIEFAFEDVQVGPADATGADLDE